MLPRFDRGKGIFQDRGRSHAPYTIVRPLIMTDRIARLAIHLPRSTRVCSIPTTANILSTARRELYRRVRNASSVR